MKIDNITFLYRLEFPNRGHVTSRQNDSAQELEFQFPLTIEAFSDAFPYHFYFDRGLRISRIGQTLEQLYPYIKGQTMTDIARIVKPMINI